MSNTLKFMTCLIARPLLLQYATLHRGLKNHDIEEYDACSELLLCEYETGDTFSKSDTLHLFLATSRRHIGGVEVQSQSF